jgi:hypothetical protein
VSQHFVSPEHSLDDFGRSKIYIIDHNPSWKENQRQKHLQRLSPHGLHWPIVDEGLDTAVNAFRSPERYNGWFREQHGQRFTFVNFFPMMTDNA